MTMLDTDDDSYFELVMDDEQDDPRLDPMISPILTSHTIEIINDTLCIYVDHSTGWVPVQSRLGAKTIVGAVNMYAPVNYLQAAAPYMSVIMRHNWPSSVHMETFTMGTIRYKFGLHVSATGVIKVCFGPSVVGECEPTALSTKCTNPIPLGFKIKRMSIPCSISSVASLGSVQWIKDVFGPNALTVLWLIGDIMSDYGQKRLWVLYGPGGVGKTTVVRLISGMLTGCVENIVPDMLLVQDRFNRHGVIGTEQMLSLAQARLICCNDVEVPRNVCTLNMQIIKALTGGDSVNGVVVQCNVIACMNRLVPNSDVSEYVRPDRLRRIVVIPTLDERVTHDRSSIPSSMDHKTELVRASLATRLYYSLPPMTLQCVLMTVLQGKYTDVWSIVRHDTNANIADTVYANAMICARYGISMRSLSRSLKYMGGGTVMQYNGCRFIANITAIVGAPVMRPREHRPRGVRGRYHRAPGGGILASSTSR